MSRPTTAMTPTTDRLMTSRPSSSEAMRSDRTAGIACPLRWAATSSAVKKGFPCPRARTSSTNVGAGDLSDQSLDLRGELLATESSEQQAVRSRKARDLAETPTLLRVNGDLVGAVGADQHDVFIDEIAGEKIEQVPRQRVGPVQILERDDDRTVTAEAGDELEQRREQRAGRLSFDRWALRDPVAQRCQCGALGQSRRVRSPQRCGADRPAARAGSARRPSASIGRRPARRRRGVPLR